MFKNVNLPKPSNELLELVDELVEARTVDPVGFSYIQSLQAPGENYASGDFFSDPRLMELALAEYNEFFSAQVYPIIGLIQNTKDVPASYPPHSDWLRNLGLNYYIELGGKNVSTVFYDKVDPLDDKEGGHPLSYKDAPPVLESVVFEKDKWYLLPARQYHSVENIESKRILLSFAYLGDPQSFLDTHPHLIIND